MYTNNLEQLTIFIYFIITGMVLGIIFDIFRILRKSFKTSDIVTNIEDIIFGITTGIILLVSIFLFNNGELRLFIFIGIILGTFIYMLLISRYFIKLNVAIINLVKKIIIVETELGMLSVKGDNLRINKLSIDTSEVIVEGEIISLTYSTKDLDKKGESFLGKIFK